MSETKPIPIRNTTLPAVAKGVNDVHACLEGARKDIGELRKGQQEQALDMAHLKGTVDGIAIGLGLPTSSDIKDGADLPRRRSVLKRINWQTIATMVAATSGALLLFRIIAAVWPAVAHALMTIR